MTSTDPPPPADPAFEQEVRFALVMYGGVSLAIYINGVTQEFLHLVRATAVDWRGDLIEKEVAGTAAVYRELASILRPTGDGAPDGTLHTRFLVDIASGTSAGGINAIFLGKALANGGSLDQLTNLWLDKGNLKDLLNDTHGADKRKFAQRMPKSLLSSSGMYSKLLSAFVEMDAAGKPRAPLQPEMDVFITATDLHGLELPIALADMQVFEKRHKNVFQLRFASDGTNDFGPELNGFLAFAARATSSFPVAFEPMRLVDIDTTLSANSRAAAALRSGDPAFERFFPDYISESDDNGYRARAFGDGGYLDNKPFSYAIDTLARRTTELPMRRKLVYIEPSPDDVEEKRKLESPNFIENALAATLTLKQNETIREDLQRILDRNRLIERVHEVTSRLEDDIRQWKSSRHMGATRAAGQDYKKRTLADEIAERGPGYAGYHRLKLRAVVDDLAGIVTRAKELLEASDEFRAIRLIVGEWRRQSFRDAGDDSGDSAFLLAFDLSYRQRRMRFLLTKLDERYASQDAAGRMEIRRLKTDLNRIAESLGALQRNALERGKKNLAYPATRGLKIDASALRRLLAMPATDREREIRDFVTGAFRELDAVANAVAGAYREVLIQAAGDTEQCLDANNPGLDNETARELRVWLRHFFEEYDYYDQVVFPIFYETSVGEAEPADVIRISPRDAQSVIDETAEDRRKLAGTTLFHFGAFFDRLWRSNDILWGRLDGAERIIASVLPRGSKYAPDLIRRAHLAIVREHLRPQEQAELKDLIVRAILRMPRASRSEQDLRELLESQTRAPVDAKVDAVFTACLSDEEIYHYLQSDYRVSREFNPAFTLDVLGRAAKIIGNMFEDLAKSARSDRVRAAAVKPAAWVARLGTVFWSIVQVAVPGGLGSGIFRHWLKILYAFEALLLIGSTLAVSPETQQFAVTALLLTAGVHLFATVLGDLMRARRWYLRAPVFILAAIFTILAFLGAWAVRTQIAPRVNSAIERRLPWARIAERPADEPR
jgi:patatin-related protein